MLYGTDPFVGMLTEEKEERFALCDPDGRILYVTPDMFHRIQNPLDGRNIKEFLNSMDQARFDAYRFSKDKRITFNIRGVRSLGALMLERSQEGLGLMFRCYFAWKQGDFLPEARQIHPGLFRAAEREFETSRRAISEELSSGSANGERIGASMQSMYQSSMLLLLTTEMFFGRSDDKLMNYLMPFLSEITRCVTEWVRSVDIDIGLEGDSEIAACYEDSSFALLILTMLSILNDLSTTHRVDIKARAVLDGAYLTLITETRVDCPDFDLRPINQMAFAMPKNLQVRLHLCDVVGTTYGYGVQCELNEGRFTFAIDMPHVRRNRLFVKEDPFYIHDATGECKRYFPYLFSEDEGR